MPKTILIVDDEPDILKIVSFRLEANGYKILLAKNGQEALDLVQNKRPDIVLLDLRLPDIDGCEVCRKIKADKTLKDIPVIFLTASQFRNIKEMMKESKADDYLSKPFEPKELLEKVKKFVG